MAINPMTNGGNPLPHHFTLVLSPLFAVNGPHSLEFLFFCIAFPCDDAAVAAAAMTVELKEHQ